MNTTMCSTSRIVPVPCAAGIASARRIDSEKALSATAAPADCATVCRKRRRLDDVVLFHLGSAVGERKRRDQPGDDAAALDAAAFAAGFASSSSSGG
ncbi:hypothetical protein WJ42_01805 [Burkholderia cepacia]|nr:hypothetical protein WJ42_01805 [Burkholderia cepacia]KWC68872.1 hypothetical protein WL55_15340 [Burkholderia cepacia]